MFNFILDYRIGNTIEFTEYNGSDIETRFAIIECAKIGIERIPKYLVRYLSKGVTVETYLSSAAIKSNKIKNNVKSNFDIFQVVCYVLNPDHVAVVKDISFSNGNINYQISIYVQDVMKNIWVPEYLINHKLSNSVCETLNLRNDNCAKTFNNVNEELEEERIKKVKENIVTAVSKEQ